MGRGTELDLLEAELLADGAPLVTLLAAGGMGKTRLALEATERLGHRFDDGAVVVWLAGAATLDQAAPALAEALGLEAALTPFAMRRRLAGVAPDPEFALAWDAALAMAARVAEGVAPATEGVEAGASGGGPAATGASPPGASPGSAPTSDDG